MYDIFMWQKGILQLMTMEPMIDDFAPSYHYDEYSLKLSIANVLKEQ